VLRDLELIVQLQGLDIRTTELRKEIAALPKEIALIEKALDAHQRRLDGDRAVLAGNQKERRQLDGDVQGHRQKISKLRDQMAEAKTNEHYRAFQNEIAFVEQQVKKCEDRSLELLVESEALDQTAKVSEASLKQQREKIDKRKTAVRERIQAAEVHLATLLAERKEVCSGITPVSLALYERIARKTPNAVSAASNGRCTICRLEIRPQLYQDLRRGERVIQCENCRRILHYNPPVAFDEANGGAAAVSGGGSRVDMT